MEHYSREKFICMIIVFIVMSFFGVLFIFSGEWSGVIVGLFLILGGLGYLIDYYEKAKKNFWM
jgi:uncharacterized membrane protein